jgi:hypothetical protein
MAKSRVRTIRGKNPVGWKRPFDEPIDLPGARKLVTPRAGRDVHSIFCERDGISFPPQS